MLARLGQVPGPCRQTAVAGGSTCPGWNWSGRWAVRNASCPGGVGALSCLFTGAGLGGVMEPPSWGGSSRDPEATDRGCPTQGEGCREVGC